MRVKVKGLFKSFGGSRALNGIELELGEEISILALIGPSGGGKSTLLRILCGLEIPDQGEVEIGGEGVDFGSEEALLAHRRRNGFLFQSFNLFPHKTARENITLPLELVHGFSSFAALEKADECLERFGLTEHAQKLPVELSGGQQQRTAIARAIAPGPGLLFLDEPTSALDPEITGEVLDLIVELKEGGQEIVLSTHEMGFASEVADEVAFLEDGRIIESGNPRSLLCRNQNQSSSSSRLDQFLARVMRY